MTALTVVLPMLFVAAAIALGSFLPRRLRHFFKPSDRDDRNLLYFGDVAGLKTEAFAERLRERYHPPDGAAYSERYLDDLAVQIWVHSRIADAKFKAFNAAAIIALAAVVVVAAPPSFWVAKGVARWAQVWRS